MNITRSDKTFMKGFTTQHENPIFRGGVDGWWRGGLALVALAWVIRQPGIIAIPKAGRAAHVRENAVAGEVHLTTRDLEELDRSFAPPDAKVPLATR